MKNEAVGNDVLLSVINAIPDEQSERTDGFGLASNVDYLAKCQVDTPPAIVKLIWQIVGVTVQPLRNGWNRVASERAL
jgi:hypothetical protein